MLPGCNAISANRAGIYQRIAQEEHLQLRNSLQAGLIPEWRTAMGRLGWIRRSRVLDDQDFMGLWSRARTTEKYGILLTSL